ncbi:MAG: cyclic pyranopterin monophosphate synthase MoaC [Spirochaetes bacterium]|nr:cyclic pyranopterin monophosphate synthase MoaC [Spirochaetota bacterium]
MKKRFSHLDESGKLKMVDVSGKRVTKRTAAARCRVVMKPETLRMIMEEEVQKGDVLAAARLAGIMAAKRTGDLVPLCHTLPIELVDVRFEPDAVSGVLVIESEVVVTAKTGAEMEALEAASQAALTVYDMCKAVDRGMTVTDLMLVEKSGGKSGTWKRE